MKKLINYLLSHTAALGPRTENKNGAGRYPINSITWIGINGELEKSVKTEKKYDNCPECKREVYEWSGWERVEVFDNELERNVWTYKFNSPDSKDPPKCWDSLEYAFHVYITEICYRLKKHPEIFITFSRCDDENNEMIELDVYQINLDDDFG